MGIALTPYTPSYYRVLITLHSRTEPHAFFLDVYFNAHPVSNSSAKEKPKPSNALVPTSLAYAGGQRDFAVNMGSEVRGCSKL